MCEVRSRLKPVLCSTRVISEVLHVFVTIKLLKNEFRVKYIKKYNYKPKTNNKINPVAIFDKHPEKRRAFVSGCIKVTVSQKVDPSDPRSQPGRSTLSLRCVLNNLQHFLCCLFINHSLFHFQPAAAGARCSDQKGESHRQERKVCAETWKHFMKSKKTNGFLSSSSREINQSWREKVK